MDINILLSNRLLYDPIGTLWFYYPLKMNISSSVIQVSRSKAESNAKWQARIKQRWLTSECGVVHTVEVCNGKAR